MMRVIDLVYYHHSEYNDPQQVLRRHAPALGFADFIARRLHIEFVKHLDFEGIEEMGAVKFAFFKSNNHFWHIPFKTHRYILRERPDAVIVEGLIFPLQLIFLKWLLGKHCRIIVQHHGERPFSGIKHLIQKMADRYVDTYLFTSIRHADEWISKGIISGSGKCCEVLEASTYFVRHDKADSRKRLGISKNDVFLWVGRLEKNKDPLTVLNAFCKYAAGKPGSVLYMVYHEQPLLPEVMRVINKSQVLQKNVVLVGKLAHDELVYWYSAADVYVSASHREGSGYALLEAMACGCVPLVTDIPSFRKITGDGQYGFLYAPGNPDALAALFDATDKLDKESYSAAVEKHFQEHLGYECIANDLYHILTTS